MPPAAESQNRDLTLPPDTYLYLQNEGKGGIITVHRGPTVVNQTGQDQPIKYDSNAGKYNPCTLEQALQQCPRANEGDYIILENPSNDESFPTEASQPAKPLKKGCRVVIPGPWSAALYPGQKATSIEGHRLRTNQYVLAVVYNAEAAEANWDRTIVKEAQTEGHDAGLSKNSKGRLPKPDSFAVGTRIIIKGSDVSFFIPCTGVEVIRDEKTGKYVRDAVTLEQLEYCCLIDESGKKVYPRGPAVVFPSPTQILEEDSKGRRKFRPIELNTINGLHLKVTANFEDEDIEKACGKDGKRPMRQYTEGEELFVTGKTLQIYYPREELAIIEYGQGNKKHYSTAIPKGEGRYLINRETGEIKLVRGPMMLLPDPRSEILVRRILTDADCTLWYPGNVEAVAYNRALSEAMADSPSGRSGLVSEGDWRKALAKSSSVAMQAFRTSAAPAEYVTEDVSDESAGQSVTRGTKYTQPRQLTLNTKYDGVPRIEVWPGYAVLIVGAEGSRKVVQGPQVVLLEYDEKLGFMELSTGKPKSTDRLYKTAYLCVQNNQVGDIVSFESQDHVKGTFKISLRVNFESESDEDRLRWFGTDNYVKYLTDHVRSILAGMAKRHSIAEIKADYVNLVRNAILGAKNSENGDTSTSLRSSRPGLVFPDNGMRVFEVEVLEMTLNDTNIAKMLDEAQLQVVASNIQIERARKDLEATKEQETIKQHKAEAQHLTQRQMLELEQVTQQRKLELQKDILENQMELALATIEVELQKIAANKKTIEATESNKDLEHQRNLERHKLTIQQTLEETRSQQQLELAALESQTKAAVERFQAAKDGLFEVLTVIHRDEMAAKLAEGTTIERWLSGDSASSTIANLLSIIPSLKGFMDKADAIENRKVNRLKELSQTK